MLNIKRQTEKYTCALFLKKKISQWNPLIVPTADWGLEPMILTVFKMVASL